MPLLFDRRWLGVALCHDDAPKRASELARNLAPDRLAPMSPESDLAVWVGRIEEDSPAVVRHFHVPELRPARAVDTYGRSQVHVVASRPVWAHLGPPVEEFRLPVLERALQDLVAAKIDVVRDPLGVVDVHYTRSQLNRI